MRNSTLPSCLAVPRVPRGLWWVLLFNAAMAVFLLCPFVPHSMRVWGDDAMQTLGPLVLGLVSLVRAWRGTSAPSRARAAALCVSAGVLSFGIGSCVWAYCENVLHRDVPFPSGADIFFLLAYPFLGAGFFLMPRRPLSSAARAVAGLDSLMVLTGLVTFSWYYVLGPVILGGQGTMLAKVLGAVYPLLDMVLLGCLILLSARAGGRHDVTALLGAGMASIVVIDMVFALGTLRGTYHSGGLIDALWPLGYMLMALAGNAQRNAPGHAPEPSADAPGRAHAPMHRVILPYIPIPAVAALVLQTLRIRGDEALEPGVWGGASVLFVCVLARQCFALLENRHLAARQSVFNAELQTRTQQLSALLELTAAVHDAGEEVHIVDAAHFHTQAALRADTVRICLLPEPGQTDDADDASHLHAPVQDGATILGTIAAARREPFDTATDAVLLHSIGAEVGRALGNCRRLQEARAAADRDPVTGLFNHRAIHQRLDRELTAANAADGPLSLVMMDLDNFKLFNDTYGHPVGDEVLRRVADALRDECGPDVQSARYGGDEFLLLLPGADGAAAHALARRLQTRLAREVMKSEEIVSGEQRVIPVALSCGVAAFPADSVDRHELLAIADANLYAAKGSEDGVIGSSDAQRVNRTLRSEGGFGLLDAMLTAVDNKDRYTRRHSEDVTEYALWIADEIGLPGDDKKALRQGGLLHDVGKIGVPEDILRKPGRLTPAEYDILKRHAELGTLIVGGVPGMEQILDAVRHHHERWDGGGYPDNLAGTDIPLSGRILAIADAMSAMTTNRPYRRGRAWEEAIAIVREGRGTQFDPALADAFLRAAARHVPSPAVLPRAA